MLLDRDLAAPALLRVEAANVLRTLCVRRAVTPEAACHLFAAFQALPVTLVDHDDALDAAALPLALDLGHPVYECLYLALARRMARTLVTADVRFVKALRTTPLAARVTSLAALQD